MKPSSIALSAAAVMIAGGSILTGSIVSAQSLPARDSDPPPVSAMVILTPEEGLIECTFSSTPPGVDAHGTHVPGDAVDVAPSELAAQPGDFVAIVAHRDARIAELEGQLDKVDGPALHSAKPGTPEECDQATKRLPDGGPSITEVEQNGRPSR